MENTLNNDQKKIFLEMIFPVAMASCANILKHEENKISRIAKTHLSNVEQPSIKEKFLGTRFGKLLLNPFGFDLKISP